MLPLLLTRSSIRATAFALLLSPLGASCGGGDESDRPVIPATPAAASSLPPAQLQAPIEVEIDGRPFPAIDVAWLLQRPPDHQNGPRTAWSLAHLLGHAGDRSEWRLEVESADGLETVYPLEADESGREPMIVRNQRGGLLVDLLAPAAGPSDFHGGNRGRGGVPGRVKQVVKLSLRPAAKLPAVEPLDVAPLLVHLSGHLATRWLLEDLKRVPTIELEGRDRTGQRPRESWSLRDLVRELAGEDVMASELRGQGGRGLAIDPDRWRQSVEIPVLRLNRRGEFKFEWLTAAHQPVRGDRLRRVTEIQLTRR